MVLLWLRQRLGREGIGRLYDWEVSRYGNPLGSNLESEVDHAARETILPQIMVNESQIHPHDSIILSIVQ